MKRSDSAKRLSAPHLDIEYDALTQGVVHVAGVDEAGRGPLAGSVLAAAVVLDFDNLPEGLNDSKKLTARRRELVFEQIMVKASVGVCAAPASVIDRLNIRGATLWAMSRAIAALPLLPDLALIDGRDVPADLPCQGQAVIGGDGISLSIAAASIVAKVIRDRMCLTLDRQFPHFGFASHKGYGTAIHMEALTAHGPTENHRMSFAPVLAARR